MIKIECSKAQYERVIKACVYYGVDKNGRCVLGKNQFSCPSANGKNPNLTCTQCLKNNIKNI